MSRHDAQRTAAAKGIGNLTNPVPTWRFPLGGSLFEFQAIVTDADGDLLPEFYFVRGSGAVGKRLDDSVFLQSPSMGVSGVQALTDLDGDGKPELVVLVGSNQTAVFDGATGALAWLEPATEVGYIDGDLVTDIDGDGLPDLLVKDCGCCAQTGTIPGAVYSFAGNVKAPKLIWQLPYAACGGGASTTVLDADGDGQPDVLMGRTDGFDLLAGKTGAIKASLTFGNGLQGATCVPAKITGAPGEQAVCVWGNFTSDDSGHRVFALAYVPGPTPALTVLWDHKLGAFDQSLTVKPGFVADLDGDGLLEVTLPAQDTPTTWSTHVLDAATGVELAKLDGHQMTATAPVLANGRRLILTQESDGIAGYAFVRTPAPAILPRWSLTGQSTLGFRDYALSARSFAKNGVVSVDLTGDGTPDLITKDTLDGTVRVLDTSAGAASAPPVVGSAAPPPNTGLLWSAATKIKGQPALVTGFNDGIFRLKQLQNGQLVDVAPPGVHFDGYYTTGYWRTQGGSPVVAKLRPGQTDSVLVPDAVGVLHVLDGTKADAKNPPVERWSHLNTTAPLVVPNLLNGSAGVVVVERQPTPSNPPKQQVTLLDADGAPFWISPIDGSSWSDLVTGNLDGDAAPDVVLNWGTNADGFSTVRTRAISGATGATLWEGPTFPAIQFTGSSIHDWDGDGLDDIFMEVLGLHVISGATHAEIGPVPPAEMAANAMPILADVDGDGSPEVVVQGGNARVAVLSSNLDTVLYQSQEVQSTIQYGALARCPAGDRLVESTYFYHTARLTLTDLSPPTVGQQTVIFLAGGQPFADEASATAAGVYQGVLTAVSLHENLTGQGHPTAVVGSSDGWLYALDPCSGKLDFTYNFKDAVGSASFGDTDGDGLDEIIVEVADGYLYDLKQKPDQPGGAGGTGGTPGTGGMPGTGGHGGVPGTGGAGGAGPIDEYPLYGRACTCTTPGPRDGSAPGLAAAAALALSLLRRRARRR